MGHQFVNFSRSGVAALIFSALLPAQTPSITEFTVSTNPAGNFGIAAGPDGAVWFTENAGNKIGRITSSGAITEFALPSGGSPQGITTGPDGALWFTENSSQKIGRITTSGTIKEYAVPSVNATPFEIASGPDGALWFTENSISKVGRITTSGTVTEYALPTVAAFPEGITSGPDGAMWFTETSKNKIGRITTAGVITEFSIPTTNSGPMEITAGPDGALWFAEHGGNQIGRITTAGVIQEFKVALGGGPTGITTGPDGALWFTLMNTSAIGSITTAGVVNTYLLPSAPVSLQPWGITTGPDGSLWFAQQTRGLIGRAVVAIPTAPSILAGGIVNAASYAQVNGAGSPVAPGALVAIFTSQLDTQAANFTTATLPPELSNVSVTFNNITAPMVTVSPTGQFPFVSAQVPFGVLGTQPSGTVAVVITVNGTPSKPVQESIIPSQPGIFTIPATGQGNAIMVFTNPATHQPAIAAPAGSGITYPIAPIPRGTPAFFYVNGLGLTTPPVPDGGGTCPAPDGACAANATPTVLVGGISAPVSFAGQAPGFPGVFQVNIMIPQNAPTGDNVPVVVKSADGSVTSNTATIAVQ